MTIVLAILVVLTILKIITLIYLVREIRSMDLGPVRETDRLMKEVIAMQEIKSQQIDRMAEDVNVSLATVTAEFKRLVVLVDELSATVNRTSTSVATMEHAGLAAAIRADHVTSDVPGEASDAASKSGD